MKKLIGMFILICTLSCTFFYNTAIAANHSFYVVSVSSTKANIYTLPKSSSSVLCILNKGDEYPVIATNMGDSTASVVHTVVLDDTLWSISNQYGVSISDLQKENELTTEYLYIEQKLRIPQKTKIHSVIAGESLWRIAYSNNVTVNDLTHLNHLKSTKIVVGEKLKIPDYYVQVELLEGKKGWIRKSVLQTKKQNQVIMGWNKNRNTELNIQQSKKPNLNVVSPRWFTLNHKESIVTIKENAHFVRSMHNHGKRVWPLLGNLFNPVLTDSVLSQPEKRQKVVALLRDSLVRTDSDGINVDFENIDIKNKQDFVLFIIELKKALQPYGILVSVDVTRVNEDPFWSGSLNRMELGKAADYIVMMGYDEHWAGSSIAGSVASLPWVRDGLLELMKEVPSHKIILGVPYYTREWVTNLSSHKVASYDRTMADVEKIIKDKRLSKTWDKAVSQNYVQYTVNGEKHEFWIEDKSSMKLRFDQVKQYHLGGIAAWYLGSETSDIWTVFN